MIGILQTFAVLGLGLIGAKLGITLSKRRRFWVLGVILSIPIIVAIALASRFPLLLFVAPFSWLMAGRTEYALYAFAIPLAFATLAPRLPLRRQRWVVAFGASFCTLYLALPPFLLPPLIRGYFAGLETVIDKDGVCIQSNGYLCGPAAAVTALRHLNLPGEEGELAILAYTTPMRGTAPDCLCAALHERLGQHGFKFELRYFTTVEELKAAGTTITVIKLSLLLDHYVAVLDVTDEGVIVGDPLQGRRTLTHEELRRRWRHLGIVIEVPSP